MLSDPSSKHQRLPLISHESKGRFAITDGDWKLVMPHRKSTPELYNLITDPSESTNVIDDHADRVTAMKEKITDIVCKGRTTAGPEMSNDTGYWTDLSWLTPAQYEELTDR